MLKLSGDDWLDWSFYNDYRLVHFGSKGCLNEADYCYKKIIWLSCSVLCLPNFCLWVHKTRDSIILIILLLFEKMGHPGLFFVYFRLFKQTWKFLQQINEKKCPFGAGILNPWPSEHESPPITTRPGLPPNLSITLSLFINSKWSHQLPN